MAAVDELDTLLQSLQALKPPGVAKSKIESINTICISNVGSDSAIVEKIVANFRSAPSTHKLGVLYVVDSVTRQWIEKARQTGQALIGSAAAPGTYASGVHKMTAVLPTMMNELIVSAPATQKDKIAKLIDIWEKASTFPADILGDFKRRLEGPTQCKRRKFPLPSSHCKEPQSDFSLASAMRTFPSNGTPRQDSNIATQPASNGAIAQNVSTVTPAASSQASYPAYQLPAPVSLQPPPAQALPLPNLAAGEPWKGDIAQQFQFLSTLAASGLPPEQIAQVVAALGLPQAPPPPPIPGAASQSMAPAMLGMTPGQGYNGSAMPSAPTPDNQYDFKRPRTRSRSPDYKRRRVTPPNRRESPVYGVYDPEAAQNEATRANDFDRRGRGGRGRDRGHRRSPPGRQADRPPSPRQYNTGAGQMQPKYIKFEPDLPKGHIKVLSRTLFVGGVSGSEHEIRDIFSRFGSVQTCIVNHEKRHAFVKMVNRPDAMAAKTGMEVEKNQDILAKARSTRWGVGFGPRECSDYSTGVSVVPISALTDADKRWMLTAEYGGTGGRPIEAGMVVEEPDIEIGAGVSSKAISRRIETRAAVRQDRAPAQSRGHGGASQGNNHSQDRYGYDRPSNPPRRANYENQAPQYREPAPEPVRAKASPQILRPEPNTVGVPPAVPGFGFQLPGMNFR
ncbi:hypothetical protein NA57DRAFT_41681 [Rhizodiscina lignyota]|uniref:RNA binding protein Nrd1 n=1 Tax=Rhizodiscina lignyota TaxID=1504668 RepID=A0A9P4I8E6_9PEZI|nr:hypothetical protein NA57DRAFT_41681 [Rhizodiscina lignyota]